MTDAIDRFAPLSETERTAGQAITAPVQKDGELVSPVPDGAPQPPAHFELGLPSARWTYRDAGGKVLQIISRFDTPDGGKQFRPLTLWREKAGLRWRWKTLPAPRPLLWLRPACCPP